MTCENCIHYEVCFRYPEAGRRFIRAYTCRLYKPKSRFVELPCEVGQTVYCIPFENRIYEGTIAQVVIERIKGKVMFAFLCYGGMRFDLRDLGKTAFLSKEEAENALKERVKE